jgi:NADH-quinone oxidoreductase subunit L
VFEGAHRTLFAGAAGAQAPVFARLAHGVPLELGLMAASVLIALGGIGLARRLYKTRRELADRLAAAWPNVHRVLSRKYYVDEIYGAVFVRGLALGGGEALHGMDRWVVDGGDGNVRPAAGVNGLAWGVRDVIAQASDIWDRWVVDGCVNLTALVLENGSYLFRAVQNGLVQHYVWVMLLGVLLLIGAGPFLR